MITLSDSTIIFGIAAIVCIILIKIVVALKEKFEDKRRYDYYKALSIAVAITFFIMVMSFLTSFVHDIVTNPKTKIQDSIKSEYEDATEFEYSSGGSFVSGGGQYNFKISEDESGYDILVITSDGEIKADTVIKMSKYMPELLKNENDVLILRLHQIPL